MLQWTMAHPWMTFFIAILPIIAIGNLIEKYFEYKIALLNKTKEEN